MKKSKKQLKAPSPKKQLKNHPNPEDLIEDINKVMKFVDKLDDMDFEDIDIDKLERDSILLKKAIEDKYNHLDTDK